MMDLLIHDDAEISIMTCQGFPNNKILSLLSDQWRKCFDDLYCDRVIGRYKLDSTAVEETSAIM